MDKIYQIDQFVRGDCEICSNEQKDKLCITTGICQGYRMEENNENTI